MSPRATYLQKQRQRQERQERRERRERQQQEQEHGHVLLREVFQLAVVLQVPMRDVSERRQ